MAAKKKKEKQVYVYYKDKFNNTVYVDDSFIYEMSVYLVTNKSFELFDNKEISQKKFQYFSTLKQLTKKNKQFIQIIELIGAPLDFLESNNFKKL